MEYISLHTVMHSFTSAFVPDDALPHFVDVGSTVATTTYSAVTVIAAFAVVDELLMPLPLRLLLMLILPVTRCWCCYRC